MYLLGFQFAIFVKVVSKIKVKSLGWPKVGISQTVRESIPFSLPRRLFLASEAEATPTTSSLLYPTDPCATHTLSWRGPALKQFLSVL